MNVAITEELKKARRQSNWIIRIDGKIAGIVTKSDRKYSTYDAWAANGESESRILAWIKDDEIDCNVRPISSFVEDGIIPSEWAWEYGGGKRAAVEAITASVGEVSGFQLRLFS